ncbi:MAG: response regulator [Candidatus Eremiobacterota bacterium]
MKKQHILVAEDNILNHKLIQYYLKKSGYTADFVSNGFEVLSALKQNSYDLILMDLQMPEMDGFMTTSKIREEERNEKHIPIIALTAHAIREIRDRSMEYGMDGYITKPVDHKELIEAIDRILGNKTDKNDANFYSKT